MCEVGHLLSYTNMPGQQNIKIVTALRCDPNSDGNDVDLCAYLYLSKA